MNFEQMSVAFFEEVCLLCERFARQYDLPDKRSAVVQRIAKTMAAGEVTAEMVNASIREIGSLRYAPDLRIVLQALEAPDPRCYEKRGFLGVDEAYRVYEKGRYRVGGSRHSRFGNQAVYVTHKRGEYANKEMFEYAYRVACADICKGGLLEMYEPEIQQPTTYGGHITKEDGKSMFETMRQMLDAKPSYDKDKINREYDRHLKATYGEEKP